MPSCKYCKDITELEIEYPEEPHYGGIRYCGECEADYYEEYGTGKIAWGNKQARLNHPELNKP